MIKIDRLGFQLSVGSLRCKIGGVHGKIMFYVGKNTYNCNDTWCTLGALEACLEAPLNFSCDIGFRHG